MVPQVEYVHLPHLAGQPQVLPPSIAKRLAFYGDLARFASLCESGHPRRTPMQCRRRPARKQCRGLLIVRRRDLPAAIEWECPACSARGHISGWEETDADLRGIELDPGAAARAVAVAVQLHAVLRELAHVDDALIPLVYGAEVDDTGQPNLLVTPTDGLRYAPLLLRHALTASSDRRRGHLVRLVEALTLVPEEEPPSSSFMELDAATGRALVAASSSMKLDAATGRALVPALGALDDAREPEFVPVQPRPRPKSTKRGARKPRTYQIKVTLRDVKPPVWRRLIVPSDIRLPSLHHALQTAMGWYDCHLHAFRVRDRTFAPPGDFEPIGQDSRDVSLDVIAPRSGSRVVYEYDFGDGWCHDILVEDIIDGRCQSVRCLKGRRSCPPEDCGGPWGYAELREALADPTHERHEDAREWMPEDFDPEEFDVVYTDALVRDLRV